MREKSTLYEILQKLYYPKGSLLQTRITVTSSFYSLQLPTFKCFLHLFSSLSSYFLRISNLL